MRILVSPRCAPRPCPACAACSADSPVPSADQVLESAEGADEIVLGGGNAVAWPHLDSFLAAARRSEQAIWVEAPAASFGATALERLANAGVHGIVVMIEATGSAMAVLGVGDGEAVVELAERRGLRTRIRACVRPRTLRMVVPLANRLAPRPIVLEIVRQDWGRPPVPLECDLVEAMLCRTSNVSFGGDRMPSAGYLPPCALPSLFADRPEIWANALWTLPRAANRLFGACLRCSVATRCGFLDRGAIAEPIAQGLRPVGEWEEHIEENICATVAADPEPSDAEADIVRWITTAKACIAGGSGPRHEILRDLFGILEGRIELRDSLVSVKGASGDTRAAVAGVLAFLGLSTDAFRLIAGIPTDAPAVVAIASVLAPRLPRDTLLRHRAWILRVARTFAGQAPVECRRFVRELHYRGHFEVVRAFRESDLGSTMRAADLALMDATEALWALRTQAVHELLAAGSLDDADEEGMLEAELLAAIARGLEQPSAEIASRLEAVIRALEALRPQIVHPLALVAARWKGEIELRIRGADVREALRTVSDHPVTRLLNRISWIRAPVEMRGDVDGNLHEYVISELRRSDVISPEEATAAAATAHEADPLWRVIDHFGGNRTDACTVVGDGRLRFLDLPTSRQRAVAIQALLRERPADTVLAEFDRAAEAYPAQQVFRTYKAEVLLWLGRYEEALPYFEEALRATHNRWSYVGMGAALAGLGRDAEALGVWDDGVRFLRSTLPGEATLTYRAEVALRAGDLESARASIDGAVSGRPSRMRSWLALAEIALLQSDWDHARTALAQCISLTPGPFSAEPDVWGLVQHALAAEAGRSTDDLVALVRTVRGRLHGNASSWMYTWFDSAGRFRVYAPEYGDLSIALRHLGRLTTADADS